MTKLCKFIIITISSVSLDDFLAAMQYAHDRTIKNLKNGNILNITEIMYPWIRQNHYPVVNVELQVLQNKYTMFTKIENTTETWSIPITFAKELNINLNTSSSDLIKLGATFGYPLDQKVDFIILNLQQTGKYSLIKYLI